jgi:hypothetical protein
LAFSATTFGAGLLVLGVACHSDSQSVAPPTEVAAPALSLPDTPKDRYGSDAPYKVVIIRGKPYLKFTQNESEPFGPFRVVSNSELEYAQSERGVHSISRGETGWYYSDSYVQMRALRVDASEIERALPPEAAQQGAAADKAAR